jgi:hypothetical protein
MNEEISTPIAGDIVPAGSVDLAAPLSADEARELTSTIRNAAEMLWVLLARAHQGRAWESLGYESWEGYVRAEFDMSRSRSYQLLDQGRVIAALTEAMPEGSEVHLTEAAARDLKGVLDEVLPEVSERTAGLEPDEASQVLDEIVEEQRTQLRDHATDDDFDEYNGGGHSGPYDGPYTGEAGASDDELYDDVDDIDVVTIRRNVNAAHDVYSSLAALNSLPDDLEAVIAIIPDERHAQIRENLATAVENLNRFAEVWSDLHGNDS